jgi:hypothetical protein
LTACANSLTVIVRGSSIVVEFPLSLSLIWHLLIYNLFVPHEPQGET